MGQHLRRISACSIAAATTKLIALQHAKSDDRSNVADQARRNLRWTAWRLSEDLGGLRYREVVRKDAAPKNRRLRMAARPCRPAGVLHPPASTKEWHDRVPVPTSGSADGDRHQRETGIARDRPAPVQVALFKPLWPWPHGSKSHPSRAATGNHKARARVPSTEP
jgi:hypothetical protein